MTTRIATGLTFTAIAATLFALAAGLPPETFYTGDPGVKLIAARHAAAHPERPLEIPLPSIGQETAPYVDPFFTPHGDHSHAITSELFPLATAPLFSALGVRGLYILPAAGLLAVLAGTAWLGVLLDPRRSPPAILLTALFGTPFLFYGLEFWEHAPAAGAAAVATCLLVRSSRAGALSALGAGIAFGVSVLLRPEAVWYAAAVLVAARWMPEPPGPSRIGAALAGIGLTLIPPTAYALAHFGHVVTPHIAGNPAIWAPGWLDRRAEIFLQWFAGIGPASAWITAPVLLLSLSPLGRHAERRGRLFLALVAGVTLVLTWLSAPNDGGGQWGPRYLLPAFIPMSVLAADAVAAAARYRRPVGVIAVAGICLGAAVVQRMGYQRLRGTKEAYGRVLAFVEATVPEGGYAVTNLWWLDQVAASAADRRVFLYAPDGVVASSIVARLSNAAVTRVTLVGSRDEPADQARWLDGTCYVVGERQEIAERGLVATVLERRCD